MCLVVRWATVLQPRTHVCGLQSQVGNSICSFLFVSVRCRAQQLTFYKIQSFHYAFCRLMYALCCAVWPDCGRSSYLWVYVDVFERAHKWKCFNSYLMARWIESSIQLTFVFVVTKWQWINQQPFVFRLNLNVRILHCNATHVSFHVITHTKRNVTAWIDWANSSLSFHRWVRRVRKHRAKSERNATKRVLCRNACVWRVRHESLFGRTRSNAI